ncbi:hypothetical protein EDEG_02063 [Edhazardia aedis USNM 41457]|uniref:Uncharacterized protein n=1 Tax=Edhazardia aedis (strain USNM 41457) TaxID=1003232 RepID=J8ZVE8_EDHAE|nr:hypothetical protein EDEG_02063 [Edhazardia aedis USNM 41457]|eukprot:EJW03613.1 hypothetical protein EDEG_02063 [Edhazardia aedis USNM 41457]
MNLNLIKQVIHSDQKVVYINRFCKFFFINKLFQENEIILRHNICTQKICLNNIYRNSKSCNCFVFCFVYLFNMDVTEARLHLFIHQFDISWPSECPQSFYFTKN